MPQTLDNLTYTWNNSGTTFTGIKYNVTDTASAAGSLLMDLQVGGASRFRVNKAGGVVVDYPASTAGTLFDFRQGGASRASLTSNAIGESALSVRTLSLSNGFSLNVGQVSVNTNGGGQLSVAGFIGVGGDVGAGNPSTRLYADAANTLAQRNGVNAQTKRLYGTYTDASNYRRLTQTMSTGGVAEIKPEGAGTGASGNVLHISGLPTSNPGPGILWNDAGTVKVGT